VIIRQFEFLLQEGRDCQGGALRIALRGKVAYLKGKEAGAWFGARNL